MSDTDRTDPPEPGPETIESSSWYVLDDERDAVVGGPHEAAHDAAVEAGQRGAGHVVVLGARLEAIRGTTTLVWETGDHDVDLVTDGGQDLPSEPELDPALEDAVDEAVAMVQEDNHQPIVAADLVGRDHDLDREQTDDVLAAVERRAEDA